MMTKEQKAVGFLIGRACIVAAVTELLEGKTERYNGMA